MGVDARLSEGYRPPLLKDSLGVCNVDKCTYAYIHMSVWYRDLLLRVPYWVSFQGFL